MVWLKWASQIQEVANDFRQLRIKDAEYLFCDLFHRNFPFVPVCVYGFQSFSLFSFTGG